jgi:hypothetical protein
MKALTFLCTADRPIADGLHNTLNCKKSLTVRIYIYSQNLFVLLETTVFDITYIKHVGVNVLCAALFTANKQAINN